MPPVSRHSDFARRKTRGFSLVEILVVVMVILVIAAIAIPNLVRGKMSANEAAAAASVKNIHSAEIIYQNSYPDVGYSSNLANLGTHGSNCETPTSTNACIIMDDALTSGLKSGYIFDLVGDGTTPTQGYTVTAAPESSATGRCSVSTDQGGALRFFTPGATTASKGRLSQGSGGSSCEL